jgi:hypothetical protein
MRGGGGYWGKTGHASFYPARRLMTQSVISRPPITAMQKVYSITSSAVASTRDGTSRSSALTFRRTPTFAIVCAVQSLSSNADGGAGLTWTNKDGLHGPLI